MTRHLSDWDDKGKLFAAENVLSNNYQRFVEHICKHHRKEHLKAEFKDLTDLDIDVVKIQLDSDDPWKQFMMETCLQLQNGETPVVKAAQKIIEDISHVKNWDNGGKTWAKKCSAS